MGEYDLCVNMINGWGGTGKQTDRHINTMSRPGLEAGPSENILEEEKNQQQKSLNNILKNI